MEENAIVVNMPKELLFDGCLVTRLLKLENTSNHTVAFKVKSNNKTALSINPTHDFIKPNSSREIPVKLLEMTTNVKLEINYAMATQEMIGNNDSKLTNIDKKQIFKNIIKICIQTNIQVPATVASDTFSIQQQNNKSDSSQIKENDQKTESMLFKQPKKMETLQVVVQHEEQDLEDFEQKKKLLLKEITSIEEKITKNKELVANQREQNTKSINQLSLVKPYVLFAMILVGFLFGSLINYLLL